MIAYVYDQDGTFPLRCHTEMVDLKKLSEESIAQVRGMLERHVEYTESTIARRILENWDASLGRFVRVMPRDYARVLRDRRHREVAQLTRTPE